LREVDGSVAEHGGTNGEMKGLTCGAHMLVTRKEKRCNHEIRKPERKAPLGECAKAGPAGLDSKEGFKNGIDFEFQRNFEFGKTLRNFTRRFRSNLYMRIFLKFF
jgi:hypothetical protein